LVINKYFLPEDAFYYFFSERVFKSSDLVGEMINEDEMLYMEFLKQKKNREIGTDNPKTFFFLFPWQGYQQCFCAS
jgi:hypothetical protein